MESQNGFLFIFNENQSAEILNSIALKNAFTAVVNAPNLEPKAVAICFLSFSKNVISHAALVQRGHKVVTAQHAFKFFEVIKLVPISFDAIQANIGDEFRSYF